jgi:hypothetical protein
MEMKSLGLRRYALAIGVAAAMLTGCGESQPPIGAPGVMPQSRAIATHAAYGKSWMLPEAKSKDLLYVSGTNGDRYVFTYPKGKLVGTLAGFFGGSGECVDSSGDVFLPSLSSDSSTSSIIYEYAHGGTTPIAMLNDTGIAGGCSIDPASGDLAVANRYDTTNPYDPGFGSIAVYPGAQGVPKLYYDAKYGVLLCGYDNSGHLYVSIATGQSNEAQLARLSKSRGSLVVLTLDKQIYLSSEFAPVPQWDGSHVAISFDEHSGLKESSPITVYQLQISGTKATVIGISQLNSPKNHHAGQTWIQRDTIVAAYYDRGYANIGTWAYPAGGNLERSIRRIAKNATILTGVTVSVAPR